MTILRSRSLAFLKSPLAIATIFVFAIVTYFYIFRFHGNIYGFFRIGSILPFSPYLNPHKALIFKGELGFDGQQFLSVAFDPFLNNPDTLLTLDSPRLRYRRILYPFLGYILGLGNTQIIPYVLVAINIFSILAIVWVIDQSLSLKNRNQSWQSLLVLCVLGVWIVLFLSAADLLNSFLVIAAFYLYTVRNFGFAALALSFAFLTKESSVMMGIALLIDSAWKRQRRPFFYLLAAYIPASLWNIYVLIRLKSQGFLGVNENFVFPGAGFFQKIIALSQGGWEGKNLFEAYSFFLLIAIFSANLFISLKQPRNNRVIFLATLLYGLLFVSSSMAILEYFLSYPRVYMESCYLLLLSDGDRFNPLKYLLMAAAGVSSVAFIFGHT